jgi:hypothetical protein
MTCNDADSRYLNALHKSSSKDATITLVLRYAAYMN